MPARALSSSLQQQLANCAFQWICEHVNSCSEFILREGLADFAQPMEQIQSSSLWREEVRQEAHCGRGLKRLFSERGYRNFWFLFRVVRPCALEEGRLASQAIYEAGAIMPCA